MKKVVLVFLVLAMLLTAFVPTALAEQNQVVSTGGTNLYNAGGEQVSGTAIGQNGSVVSVTKSISQYMDNGVPVENMFEVELQVQTTQDLLKISSASPDAAVTLVLDVSSSMTECVNCGHREDNGCHDGRNPQCGNYVARLAETKAAAAEFVRTFAALGMENVGDELPRRMVSVITFAEDAVLHLDYIDVANSANLLTVIHTIQELNVASGTNIEGGLRLAQNVISNGRTNENEIKGIDYLYTILLTDGEPSMGIERNANRESTTRIPGSWDERNGWSYSTDKTDIDEIPATVSAIRGFTPQSRLFSICLGVEVEHSTNDPDINSTMALKPFQNWPDLGTTTNTTIGDWLRSFSNAVFGEENEATTGAILENFESVMSQIELAAKAWEVRVTMGEHIDYVAPVPVNGVNNVANVQNEVLTWNLLQSTTDPEISSYTVNPNGSVTGVLGYTFRYVVELDNFHTGYDHGTTDVSEKAVLDFAIEDSSTGAWVLYEDKPFVIPEVDGYTGMLTFKKVDENNDPIAGMNFTIKSFDAPVGWMMSAVSGTDGTVTFNNIPSGHTFRLDEETTAEYRPIGDIDFDVDWGEVSHPANTLLENVNGTLTLVNEIIPTGSNEIDLVVTKTFVDENNNPLPVTALSDPAKAYAHFDLLYPNGTNEHINLYTGNMEKRIVGLAVGEHVLSEMFAPVEGYELVSTSVTFADSLDPNARATISTDEMTVTFDAERDADSPRTYTANYTNVYRRKAGSLVVTKDFGCHDIHNHTCDQTPHELYEDVSGVSLNVSLYSVSDLTTPVKTIAVSESTGWRADFGALPEGEYVLKETGLTGEVEGHVLAHSIFANVTEARANTSPVSTKLDADATLGYRFTVRSGSAYTVELSNHYVPYHSEVRVFKHFHGDVDGAEEFVELYRTLWNDPDAEPSVTVYFYEGQLSLEDTQNASPTATIVLNEANTWTNISPILAAGTYTIVEDSSNVLLPGYAHSSNHPLYVTIGKNEHEVIQYAQLGNTYTQNPVAVTLEKEFVGYEDDEIPTSITFTITDTADAGKRYSVTLPEQGAWEKTFALPVGTYTISEDIAAPSYHTRVHAAWEGLTNDLLEVKLNTPAHVVCTNSLERMQTVTVPFVKTVVQEGDIALPDSLTFEYFMDNGIVSPENVNASFIPGSGILMMDARQENSGVVLTVECDPDGFDGTLEFRGFAEDLAKVSGTVYETIYPYVTEAEANDAGWYYDGSEYFLSLSGTVVGSNSVTVLRNGESANALAFTNTFRKYAPIPPTGDNDAVAVYAGAMVLSLAAVAVVLKKRGAGAK